MSRRIFHNALANPPPTGNGSFPPLCPDTTQHVFWELEASFLCMLKSVSSCVANACRRQLRERPGSMDFVVFAASITFPFYASLFVRSNDDLETPYSHSEIFIVHALTMEVWRDHERLTKTGELLNALQEIAGNKSFDDESRNETQYEVVCPMFCLERPGVGIFHSLGDLCRTIDLPQQKGRMHYFPEDMELLWNLHPFVAIGPKRYPLMAEEVSDITACFPTNLPLLMATGHILHP